jgi:hypothetical protein
MRGVFFTIFEYGVIIKQIADWCRTISAGAIILGFLNPAIMGDVELTKKAVWIVGVPTLVLCLVFSVSAAKLDSWKKGT